jgi:hypothetical protein
MPRCATDCPIEKQTIDISANAPGNRDPASVDNRKARVRSVGKNRCVKAVRPIRNI